MVNIKLKYNFAETPRKFTIAELSIRKLGSSTVLYYNCFIISTDEDPSLRIESSAMINLRGVSTKSYLNKFYPLPPRDFTLYHRVCKICNTKLLLNNQIEIIKSFMSWNGYPKSIQNFLMKKLKTKYSDSFTSVTVNEDTVDNLPKIWIRIPYLGSRGDFLLKSCVNKVQRFLSKPVKFVTIYDTKKLSYFVSNKDKLPPLSRSNVVHEVACPGCGETYISMTQRCLSVRLKEHATMQAFF